METIQKNKPMIKKMKVEVWSDIMCPFCYIGKRRYEFALKQFGDKNQVEIIWKSFQLDPSIPEDINPGITSVQYLASRKGISPDQVKSMHKQVAQMAEGVGLEYHLDDTLVYNSFKAHRVIQFAKTKGLGDLAEEIFFNAHFTGNKNLSDIHTLIETGKEIRLTEAEVREALTDEEYARRVRQDIAEAQQIGVTGVPFFVFNRKYAVSGAQPAEVFLQTLESSFAEWRKENPVIAWEVLEGNVCTPDGECS